MHRLRHLIPLVLLGAAVTAACSQPVPLRALCSNDAECISDHGGNENWMCVVIGEARCVCKNDQACKENEYCQPVPSGDGDCHPIKRCDLNLDCQNGAICGPDSICRVGCTSDLQCRIGMICDSLQKACVPGCYSHGDCPLREACQCKDPGGHPTFCTCNPDDHTGCQVGQCVAGTCPDKSFCAFGDLCQLDDKGVQRCVPANGPYCDKCNNLTDTECQSLGAANFCLVNQASRDTFFCGVDCDQGQECPNGYGCDDVLVLTRNVCQSDSSCSASPTARACTTDAQCGDGNRCTPAGHCAGKCYAGEGAVSGFCSCVEDGDCPTDSCASDGRCQITRKPCVGGANDTCSNGIHCINQGGVGYCKIGRNCGPAGGLTCAEIQKQ